MNPPAFPYQRLTLSILGISILVIMWRWATFHLYSIPEHSITAFTSVTNHTVYSISAIVVFMITGKLVWDWKNQTVSQVVQEAQEISENYKGETTERIIAPKAFDDVTEIQ